MIDEKTFLVNQLKYIYKTYDNIQKIATNQGDDYTSGCLLDYNYFKNIYKYNVIAIDLSKQQALDGNLKAIQKINFIWNLLGANDIVMFFII